MTEYLESIYTDVRLWLLSMFPDTSIHQAYQNLLPISYNGIIMTFMLEKSIDQTSTTYDKTTAFTYNSVQGTMQIDCYGDNSHAMARQISTMWFSPFTCESMPNIQPLYARDPRNMTFVNETGQYESRHMVELELQYNTNYEQSITTVTTVPNVDITGI